MTETPAEKLERKRQESTGRAPGPSRATKPPAQPQDHKKPKPKPGKDGLIPVEVEGVTVKVDPAGAKDWRFIEASGAVDAGEGQPADLYQMVALMIPDREDRRKLSQHVADEDGHVDAEKFFDVYRQALEGADLGNS